MLNNIICSLLLIILLSVPAFAGESPSFGISVEAFGGGATFDASSTNFQVAGLINGKAYGIRPSTNYRVGEGFMNASFNSLATIPIVTSISPASGADNGSVNVTIHGANFETGILASLERTAETDITGESLTFVDSTQITCTFNLLGRTTGAWDVVVTNPNGSIGSLAGGFTIRKPSGRLTVIGRPINFPNPFDPEKETTTIKYDLSKDAYITLNLFNINGVRIWQRKFAAGTMGGQAGTNQILWDGYTAFNQLVPNGIYVFQIESGGETLATGKIAVFR